MKCMFPPDKPRPVSLLDRLYTCNGVQNVVGGRSITSVSLNAAQSINVVLTHTITPNKRLVTIDIVDDSTLGKQ